MSVKFIDHARSVILVPITVFHLLQHADDKSFVFAEVAKGRYMRRYVDTGLSVDDNIIITEGLNAGESIITEGAFYLLDAK